MWIRHGALGPQSVTADPVGHVREAAKVQNAIKGYRIMFV